MQSYERAESLFTSATNGVDFQTMQNAIWINTTITTLFIGMQGAEDGQGDWTYQFLFDAAISTAEETELDVLIAAHTGKAAPPPALDLKKTECKAMVDSFASEARARYITDGVGQDAVYIEKEKEAKDHKNAGYPSDLTNYKMIEAQKNADGSTEQEASDFIIATASSWIALAAQIEEIRLDYKNQIDAATDENTIEALTNKVGALLFNI